MYIDNFLVSSVFKNMVIEVKKYLHEQFTIKDMSFAKFFLNLEIAFLKMLAYNVLILPLLTRLKEGN